MRARRAERSRSPGPRSSLRPTSSRASLQPPIPNPPPGSGGQSAGNPVPRVIPLEPLPGDDGRRCAPPAAPRHRVPDRRDRHGSRTVRRSREAPDQTRRSPSDLSNMIETVHRPEAEISLVEGQTKVIQTRRELTRIVISNPLVADVELLTDQPSSRLVNLYGKTFGTTSLTMWDQTNRPVSFLVRVITRHQGPELADSPGISRCRREGPPGRARRSSWTARYPTRRRCRTSSSS